MHGWAEDIWKEKQNLKKEDQNNLDEFKILQGTLVIWTTALYIFT